MRISDWSSDVCSSDRMGFYALGNLASALSPDYHAMLLFRFIAGLPHGAYFGVAALVAASISPTGQSGRAVGLVMLGLSIALLVGNPLEIGRASCRERGCQYV